MSYYPDVKPGDDWKPEPAPRYNAVNRMLGDLGYSGAGRGAPGIENFNIVSTVNRHTAAISAGMAVEAVSAPADADVPVIPVKPSAGASGAFYGVALDTLEPGDVGWMLLTGVTTVQLSSAPAAGTQYVEPDSANPGKFKAATGGRARVLVTDAGIQPDGGTPRPTATVMLGGGGTGSGDYNGYFKVVLFFKEQEGNIIPYVRVIDGRKPPAEEFNPENDFCGYLQFGSGITLHPVPVTELPLLPEHDFVFLEITRYTPEPSVTIRAGGIQDTIDIPGVVERVKLARLLKNTDVESGVVSFSGAEQLLETETELACEWFSGYYRILAEPGDEGTPEGAVWSVRNGGTPLDTSAFAGRYRIEYAYYEAAPAQIQLNEGDGYSYVYLLVNQDQSVPESSITVLKELIEVPQSAKLAYCLLGSILRQNGKIVEIIQQDVGTPNFYKKTVSTEYPFKIYATYSEADGIVTTQYRITGGTVTFASNSIQVQGIRISAPGYAYLVVHLAPEGMTGAIEMHEGNFHGEDTDYVEMIGRFEYETSGLYCKSDNSIGKNIQVTGRWY